MDKERNKCELVSLRAAAVPYHDACRVVTAFDREMKMSESTNVESRLTNLERDLAELKQQVGGRSAASSWIKKVTGSFKDDPEFDEILRLGRELRKVEELSDDAP